MYLFALFLWLASPLFAHENMDSKSGVLEVLPLTNQWMIVITQDKAGPFTIHSMDDPNYSDAKPPARVTDSLVALDKKEPAGIFDIEWVHYNYLELPQALLSGHTYTIASTTKQEVDFTYDETTSISRAIKVNQLGYLPEASCKYGYLSAWLPSFGPLPFDNVKTFEVINATSKEIAYEGPLVLREKNPHLVVRPHLMRKIIGHGVVPELFGEDIYEMNFSGLKNEGDYYIFIPRVGRSFSFHIGPDIYGEAFYHTARTLFQNRCGMDIAGDFTAWPRSACHNGQGYMSDLIPFTGNIRPPSGYNEDDVIAESLSPISAGIVTGGWHGALDASKRLDIFTIIFDLLGAYELNPKKFSDGQLHIPESGNGIPDILDEAEYGLRFAQNIFPADFIAWNKNTYAISRKSRWGALLYAAAAADFAKLVAPFSKEKAHEYLESAKTYYEFGLEDKNGFDHACIHARTRVGDCHAYTIQWSESDRALAPYLFFAKLNLYLASGEQQYLDDIAACAKFALRELQPKTDLAGFETWICFLALRDERIIQTAPWKRFFCAKLNHYTGLAARSPYHISWDPHDAPAKPLELMPTLLSRTRTLLVGANLLHDELFRETASYNLDFLFGANPQCMSWVTGIGTSYPPKVFERTLGLASYLEAPPGLVIFGPGKTDLTPARAHVWQKNPHVPLEKKEGVPLFRQWVSHPENMRGNQFDLVQLESPAIFATACLMGEKWMPNAQLLERKPRAKVTLPSYYPLP
jgi:hypothetical protein